MKLLFLGNKPSKELQQAFDHHHLSTAFAADERTLPPSDDFEVVIWKLSDPKSLSSLGIVRAALTKAWIAIIVPDAWLSSPGRYSEILNADDKDDVWLESSWEAGFWLGLQRAVQHRASLQRELKLQQELQKIQLEQEHLAESSAALLERMEKDVGLATQIHRKYYPKFSPDVAGVTVLSKYLPASGKGGDYFDIFEYGDKKRFGLLLADATSHRTAASLLSVLLKLRLDDLRGRFADSASFVSHLNEAVRAEQPQGKDTLTVLYAVFDRSRLTLDVTCAGRLTPRLWRKGTLSTVALPSHPALVADTATWTSHSFQMEPADTLLFHSNGLSSAFANHTAGLEAILSALAAETESLDRRNKLLAEVDAATLKTPLPDDLTFILLNVDANAMYMRPTLELHKKS